MARDVDEMYGKIFEMLAMVGRMGKPTDFDKRALDWRFQFLSKNLKSGHILCNLLDEVTSGCFHRRNISIDASPQVDAREESSRRNARNFFNVLAEEFAYINPRIGETDLFTLPLLPRDDVKRDYLLELLCALSGIPEMNRLNGVTKIQHFPITSQFRSRPRFDFNGDLGEIGVPYDPVASDFYNEVPPTPYDEVPEDDVPPAIPPRPLSTLSRLSVMDADVPIPVYDANPSDLYTVLMSPYDMDSLGGDVEEDGVQTGAYMGQQQIYGIPGQIEIRTRIIDELVSSELTYLSLLRDIDQHWIKPLSEILSKEDMKAVFINLMKIKEIHENFYKDIKRESEKQFESRKISECFLKMMSNLLEYKEYLTKIESAKDKMKLIDRDADKNPAYKRALHVIRTNAEQSRIICKREVQEALVIPMERLCRYPLFVERLINKSGPEHPDYDNLKIVFELLKEINSYVNACSGDNTGILERNKISRRTGVPTKEFGFPLRTKDKTQYKEGLNADKVSKDGEKLNWEKIEVFVFHTALVIVGFERNAKAFLINVIKFEHIVNAGNNKPEVSQPEESRAVLRQRSQWKVRVKTTYGRSINYEIKFPTEQFAKTFHARLSNVYQTYTKNMKQGWTAFNIPLGYNCQNYFPKISCCKICKKLFNGLEMQGFRSTKFPNIYVHEGCIENVQTYRRPEENPYSVDPTEAHDFHDKNHRELKEKPYYVGMMERDQARRILEQSSAGQFLVRDRAGADVKQAPYAVSMVTWEKKQRHMKIFQEKSSTSLRPKYYFCEQHKYSSPVELINAFSFEKDLNDAFNDLRGNFTGPARIPDHLRVK